MEGTTITTEKGVGILIKRFSENNIHGYMEAECVINDNTICFGVENKNNLTVDRFTRCLKKDIDLRKVLKEYPFDK